jgi:hypothetical protein
MIPFLTRQDVEKELIIKLRETIEELTKDDFSDDNAEIRMAKNIGLIVDRLAKGGFLRPGIHED